MSLGMLSVPDFIKQRHWVDSSRIVERPFLPLVPPGKSYGGIYLSALNFNLDLPLRTGETLTDVKVYPELPSEKSIARMERSLIPHHRALAEAYNAFPTEWKSRLYQAFKDTFDWYGTFGEDAPTKAEKIMEHFDDEHKFFKNEGGEL